MAGRGPQSFHKRQKEQARKEKQQSKMAKRLERKQNPGAEDQPEDDYTEETLDMAEIEAAVRRSVGGPGGAAGEV
jgi:hypothetical protein